MLQVFRQDFAMLCTRVASAACVLKCRLRSGAIHKTGLVCQGLESPRQRTRDKEQDREHGDVPQRARRSGPRYRGVRPGRGAACDEHSLGTLPRAHSSVPWNVSHPAVFQLFVVLGGSRLFRTEDGALCFALPVSALPPPL